MRSRFEIVGDLWGTLESVIGMPLRDIGLGGALVESPVPLSLESVHQVALTCEGLRAPASVRVRSVRSIADADGRDYYLIGFEFLSIPPPLRSQIHAWVHGEPVDS